MHQKEHNKTLELITQGVQVLTEVQLLLYDAQAKADEYVEQENLSTETFIPAVPTPANGATGPTGPEGPIGDKGPKGPLVSVTGPTGKKGQRGWRGPQGERGEPGADVTGPKGPKGPKGEKGHTGSLTGPTGPDGVPGDRGGRGARGPAYAGYSERVDMGSMFFDNINTDVDGNWISADLKVYCAGLPESSTSVMGLTYYYSSGRQGPTGPTGPTGGCGPTGPTGPEVTGPTGPTGAQADLVTGEKPTERTIELDLSNLFTLPSRDNNEIESSDGGLESLENGIYYLTGNNKTSVRCLLNSSVTVTAKVHRDADKEIGYDGYDETFEIKVSGDTGFVLHS